MKNWSLQDIRPAGKRARHTGETRGEMYVRPAPRKEAMRDEASQHDTHEDDTHLYNDDMPVHETGEMDRPVRASRPSSDRRSMHHPDSIDVEDAPTPPRALRGRGIPLKPSPVRLYLKLAFGAILLILIATLFIMNAYSKATVTVVPSVYSADMAETFTAHVDGADGLGFSALRYELEAESVIPAEGAEDVSEYASGLITIYNEYREGTVELVKNTRFETDGMIFRIQEGVSVPGYTMEDGEMVPGTVTAKVFADTAGEDGNIDASRFTIPGLASSPEEYERVYAKSTESFTGGYVGKQSIISDDVREAAVAELTAALEKRLRAYVLEQRPAGQVLYVDGATYSYTQLVPEYTGDDTEATLRVRGRIAAPLFSEDVFASAVAREVIEDYEGDSYSLLNPGELMFSYTGNASSSINLETEESITFTLLGTPALIRTIDTEALASTLAGIKKSELEESILSHGMIDRVTYELSPGWKRSFPEDPSRITVDVAIPK